MTLDVEKLAIEVLQELDSHYGDPSFVGYGGTVKQLEGFARLVLEEAAKACRQRYEKPKYAPTIDDEYFEVGYSQSASDCEWAIRALLPEQD